MSLIFLLSIVNIRYIWYFFTNWPSYCPIDVSYCLFLLNHINAPYLAINKITLFKICHASEQTLERLQMIYTLVKSTTNYKSVNLPLCEDLLFIVLLFIISYFFSPKMEIISIFVFRFFNENTLSKLHKNACVVHMCIWRRTVARNSWYCWSLFQYFYYLNLNVMHSTFNPRFYNKQEEGRIGRFSTSGRFANIRLSLYLQPIYRCQRYRYIIFSTRKRLTPICIACNCTLASSLLLKSRQIFLVLRRITHEFINHQGHHWLKYIQLHLFMNYWIIFVIPKYHLEILILRFPLN